MRQTASDPIGHSTINPFQFQITHRVNHLTRILMYSSRVRVFYYSQITHRVMDISRY
jgi:hypothetical protein